jgi:chromosome segregation ATPase
MLEGFEAVPPPEGAPEDLPPVDPLRDGAIAELTGLNENLRLEIESARSDLAVAIAKINALMGGTAELEAKVKELETKLEAKEDEA